MEPDILPCRKDLASWQPHRAPPVLRVAATPHPGLGASQLVSETTPTAASHPPPLTCGCIAPRNVGCSVVRRCCPVCFSSNAVKGWILKSCQWKCLTCAVVKDWVGCANLCPYRERAEKGSDVLQRDCVASAQTRGWAESRSPSHGSAGAEAAHLTTA